MNCFKLWQINKQMEKMKISKMLIISIVMKSKEKNKWKLII